MTMVTLCPLFRAYAEEKGVALNRDSVPNPVALINP